MSIAKIFLDWKNIETHPEGTVIFSEQGEVDVLYVILAGEVEIGLHGQALSTEGKGGIIGEMAVIQSENDNPTVTALTEVRLARLDREQFNQFIAKNTEFALHAMTILANRLRAVNAFVSAQLGPGKPS